MVSHLSLLQISTRLPTPTNTTSFSSPANSRKCAGNRILPCLSTSTVAAPAKKKRANCLASLLIRGNEVSFCSKAFQSSLAYTNKQPSIPLEITNSSPRVSRNFAGMINLPFVSNVWLYSLINIALTTIHPKGDCHEKGGHFPKNLPLCGTCLHFLPLLL